MKRLCVFCGSASGHSGRYIDQAKKVGALLAKQNIGLVFGGGKVGIMGALADSVILNGGEVIGVIPESLVSAEVAHREITQLHIVADMHTRKKMMYELSDAFLILPGGMGTLDEMFEILTWSQLGLHQKPISILNEFGFYDSLLQYIRYSHAEGFIRAEHLGLIHEIKNVDQIAALNF